jgi:TfoX/Sxy family transcriptional regulator of competence genes
MSTTLDYVEYICSQIEGTGATRYRKMFGEYMVYVDEKPILLVCDNTVFVKILPCLDLLMESAKKGFPYRQTSFPVQSHNQAWRECFPQKHNTPFRRSAPTHLEMMWEI